MKLLWNVIANLHKLVMYIIIHLKSMYLSTVKNDVFFLVVTFRVIFSLQDINYIIPKCGNFWPGFFLLGSKMVL